jgi:23S rRNA pseudouridine1911/1915/1917 synthase
MVTVVYEDKDILVVNKPAGISVHPDEHREEGTLIQEIQQQYPEAELAHRLDKDTSGLLLVAKHHEAYEYLKSLFKERTVKKTYLALVIGEIPKDEGEVNLPIARSKSDFRKRIAKPNFDPAARPAETHFAVQHRYSGFTLLEVRPITGRTHQIRSHMASLGHPVVCDPLYGGKKFVCPAGLKRQFLHAYKLEFTNMAGEHIQLEAELPEDLQVVLPKM